MPDSSETLRSARPLVRVRLSEATQADGTKKVWHSTGDGIDLTTNVDGQGRADFQELAFHHRYLVWTRGLGIRTGADEERVASKAGRAALSAVRHDPTPSAEVLREALVVLPKASADRYLAHLRDVVSEALDSLERRVTDSVTNAGKVEITSLKRPLPELAPTWKARIRRLFGH